jgi:hypothetical protein
MAPQAFLGVTIEVDMASMKKNLSARMDKASATPAQRADALMVLKEATRAKFPGSNRKAIRKIIHGS